MSWRDWIVEQLFGLAETAVSMAITVLVLWSVSTLLGKEPDLPHWTGSLQFLGIAAVIGLLAVLIRFAPSSA